MKNCWLGKCVVVTIIAIVMLSRADPTWAASTYTVTDLGSFYPVKINDSGKVVGNVVTSQGTMHAVLYSAGSLIDLGTLGGSDSWGNGINNLGHVVGSSYTEPYVGIHGFVWTGNQLIDIGTIDGTPNHSEAISINDAGQIAGHGYRSAGGEHAFILQGGVMLDLGTFAGDNMSIATRINATGQVVGYSYYSSNTFWGFAPHAFLYSNGTMQNLGALLGPCSIATDVNDSGQVVGYWGSDLEHFADKRAFLYSGGSVIDLGQEFSNSMAFGVNNHGQIVGYTANHGAFLYENGVMNDLNTLIPADSGWTLGTATAINNLGYIVGTGDLNGQQRSFLLTPSSPPTVPLLLSPPNDATGVSITPTFIWNGVTGANRYWLMVATSPLDLPTDPTATSCPNCVISGTTDLTIYTLPHTFPFGGKSGTLNINTTYYWKVLAWNTDGTLANYSPTSHFTTGQPEATPPQRVEPWEDKTVAPTPAPKAVVITHGWRGNASGWVTTMASAFCKKLDTSFSNSLPAVKVNGATKMCQVNGWDVWVYDWREDASIEGLLFGDGGLIKIPSEVIPYADRNGGKLAVILRDENYQHIHFVAHSAGSKLIDSATKWLKAMNHVDGFKIHETFLDPYSPDEHAEYGVKADWADNYVDLRYPGFGTELFLQHAYNINTTPPPLSGDVIVCDPVCAHSQPYRFYGWSINPSFLQDSFVYVQDPIVGTAGMGYPLSVEAGHSLEALRSAFKPNEKCTVLGDVCYTDARILAALYVQATQAAGVVVDGATGAFEYVEGAGAYLYSSLKLGWAWATASLAPQQILAARTSATASTTTEEPSYLVVNVTTTTPVNTLRFNWSFATAGEGLLRVFMGGNLVHEIDQRHVTPSSPETEEVYIGGVEGPLPPGTHRLTFRFDGFGASPSGVELTDVQLGLKVVVDPTLTVTKTGTGSGTVTSSPTGDVGVYIDCGTTCSASFTSGTNVYLTATPAPGSTFAGWGGDCAADGTVTLDAAKTCTATFNLITHTLTVTITGAGLGTVTSSPAGIAYCGSTCSASFAAGTTVTLAASPSFPGSTLAVWSGDCAVNGIVTLDADKACTATFTPTHVLTVTKTGTGSGTVTSSPAGITCGATCNAPFAASTPVTLTATPAAGSAFAGWSGNADCTDGSVTLDADKSCTATFSRRPDLILTAITNPPTAVLPGGSFSVTATVKNQGLLSAASSTLRYYLSLNGVKDTGDLLLTGSRSVSSLAAGASSAGTTTVTIPSGTALGTYFLLACADDTKVVAESDETNNCRASLTAVQVTRPDLVVTAVTNPPATARRGSRISVTATVKNQGLLSAASSTLRYYLSLNGVKDTGDLLLTGSRSVSSLAVGASSAGTTTVTIPSGTALGIYFLLACADDTKVVTESDETNNCRASTTPISINP